MDTERERIEVEALKLSVEDRERLIEILIDSLDQDGHPTPGQYGGFASAEIQKSWLDEAQRRIRLVREGLMKTYSAEEVLADLRARLKDSREDL